MNKKNPSEEGQRLQLTIKGLAFYLACKHGLCPKVEGGFDDYNFSRFWDEFSVCLFKEQRSNQIEKDIKNTCDETTDNGNRPIVPILLGIIVGSLLGNLIALLLKVYGIL